MDYPTEKITHDLRHRAAVPSSFDLSPSETNPLERALTTHSWQGKWMINQQSVGMICNQLSMLIGKIIISASSLGMPHVSDKSKSRNWTHNDQTRGSQFVSKPLSHFNRKFILNPNFSITQDYHSLTSSQTMEHCVNVSLIIGLEGGNIYRKHLYLVYLTVKKTNGFGRLSLKLIIPMTSKGGDSRPATLKHH